MPLGQRPLGVARPEARRLAAHPEVRPEVPLVAHPEVHPEAHAEVRPEVRLAAPPEVRLAGRPEVRPQESRRLSRNERGVRG